MATENKEFGIGSEDFNPAPLSSRPTNEQYGPNPFISAAKGIIKKAPDVIDDVLNVIRNVNAMENERIAASQKQGFGLSNNPVANYIKDTVQGKYYRGSSNTVNEIKKIAGINPPTATNVAPAPPALPVQTPSAVVTTPSEAPAQNPVFAKHNGDVYAVLADNKSVSDAKFKEIVNHADFNLPGVGYVEDPKTGKLTRVVERPQPQTESQPWENPNLTVNERIAMQNADTNSRHVGAGIDTEKRRLDFEIKKFADTNNMKDPINYLKVAASIFPKVKKTISTEQGIEEKEGPDIEAGIQYLEKIGFPRPKGINLPTTSIAKMTEQQARIALTAKGITGKAADQYINNYKKSGVVS